MMRVPGIASLGALLLLSAAPVLADGKVYVQLPNLASYEGARAEQFLHQVVVANVVSSNCADYAVTDAEWSLLTDSGDILAKQLDIDSTAYDKDFYGPAFDLLDKPGTCAAEGPNVEYVLRELVEQGGSREPLANQAAAAIAAGDVAGGKIKTK